MTSFTNCIPQSPQDTVWDVVIVGTGAGGAAAGYNLARLGRSVLFLERGRLLNDESTPAARQSSPGPAARVASGWWPHRIARKTPRGEEEQPILPIGCGTGGSTALFGMAMDRFRAADFTPRRFAPRPEATTLPDSWPISLDELAPYYAQAETLFRVRGTEDPLFPANGCLREPLAPSDTELRLHDALTRSGLNPYRLHYAREHVPGCTGCFAEHCPRRCRNDAGRICVLPALREHGARVLPNCFVSRLETEHRRVRRAIVVWNGNPLVIRANVFILALGAVHTPALLLRSTNETFPQGLGNSSGLVGRNFMLHVSDKLLVRPHGTDGRLNAALRNGLSMNDFYVRDGVKLGNVHTHAWQLPKWFSSAGGALFHTIVEDFPYAGNRVLPDPRSDEDVLWEYHYPEELRVRSRMLVDAFTTAVRKTCSITVMQPAGQLNGHVCGTCRFGDDPRTSVLDRNNRMHDLENAYVVDASFFPSSGGINPSLTIVANSLRASSLIARH